MMQRGSGIPYDTIPPPAGLDPTLRARKTLAEADNPPPFYQPVEKDIEHIEAALKTLGSYVAQQDPDGEMGLLGRRRPPKA